MDLHTLGTTGLSGAATAERLRSNLKALAAAWGAQAVSHLAALVKPTEDYWERRSDLESK
jgi:aryl-alcohol dehydrogenase-like predicted oxidoreductase